MEPTIFAGFGFFYYFNFNLFEPFFSNLNLDGSYYTSNTTFHAYLLHSCHTSVTCFKSLATLCISFTKILDLATDESHLSKPNSANCGS